MLERPLWEVEVPLRALAAAPFPRLVFSGNWHPAYNAICEVLEQRAGFERVVIEGKGHGVSLTGRPFNDRLVALFESVEQQ